MAAEKAWREAAKKVIPSFADFDPEAKRIALLITDMQRAYVDPEQGAMKRMKLSGSEIAKYYVPRVRELVVPNLAKLLKFFREHKLQIVYAEMGPLMPDGSDELPLRRLRNEQLIKQTGVSSCVNIDNPVHDTIPELKPEPPNELVFYKKTRSVFMSTGIDHTLRMLGIDTLAIGGVGTNVCVAATALNASDLGYKTILLDDGSGHFEQSDHDSFCKVFSYAFGKVMDCGELIETLSKQL